MKAGLSFKARRGNDFIKIQKTTYYVGWYCYALKDKEELKK